MAEAELSVVIRLRDLLTQELKRLDGVLAQFQAGATGNFDAAARSAAGTQAAIGQLGAQATQAGGQVAQAGAASQASLAGIASAVNKGAASLSTLGPKATVAAAQTTTAMDLAEAAYRQTSAAASTVGPAATIAAAQAQAAAQTALASQTQLRGGFQAAAAAAAAATAQQGALAGSTNAAAVAANNAAAATSSAANGANNLGNSSTRAAQGVAGLGNAANGSSVAVAKLGGVMRAAILPILPFLTAAGAGFAALQSVKSASEFSREMAAVSTVAQDGSLNLRQLRSEVLALSREFGQAPVDQARGLYFAISSGAESAAQGVEILRASTQLAIAGLSDTESTVDLVTSAINAYRNQNLSAAEAADVLFKTVEVGKGRVEDLALNYGKALPLGAALGVSFNELSAALATLTLTQGSVEQSATSLRSVLSGLIQINDDQRASLAALGAAVDPVSIKANGLVKTLVDLSGAIQKDTDAARAIFPDIRALSGVLALVNDNGDNLNRVLGRFEQAAGSVGRAVDIQLNDPARQLSIILNAARVAFQESFGNEVLNQVSLAAKNMGGASSAADLVASAVGRIGSTFAAALPGIIRGIENTLRGIDDLGARLESMIPTAKAFGAAFIFLADAIYVSINAAVQVLDLLKDSIGGVSSALANVGLDEGDIKEVEAVVLGINDALSTLESGSALSAKQVDVLRGSLDELDATVRDSIRVRVGGGINFIDDLFGDLSVEKLKEFRFALNREIASIGTAIQEGGISDALRRALTEFDIDTEPIRDKLEAAFGGVKAANAIKVPIEVQVERQTEEVARLEAQIVSLREQAKTIRPFGLADEKATTELEAIAGKFLAVQEELDKARVKLGSLREESREELEIKLKAKTEQLEALRSGLGDARSAAEQLGLTAQQSAVLVDGSFKVGRIQQLEAEILSLRRTLEGEPISLRLEAKTAELDSLERRIAEVQDRTKRVIALELNEADNRRAFNSLAKEMSGLQESASNVRVEVAALKGDLRDEIRLKISAKQDEIRALEESLADTRSTAQQLGLTAEQAGLLADSSFRTGSVQKLRAEVAGLERDFAALSDVTVVRAPRIDFSDAFAGLGRAVSDFLGRIDFDRLEKVAREALQKGLIDGSQQLGAVDEVVELFRGGVEPSLERQLDLIDDQVQRQRDAVEAMREMRLVSEGVADQFDAATDALERSKQALIEAAAEAQLLSEIRASEVGIDVRFVADLSQLDKMAAEAERRFQLSERAVNVGIEVVPEFDEAGLARQVAGLEREIEAQLKTLDRSALEREALRFGLSIDKRSSAQLEVDIRKERDRAQEFIQSLADEQRAAEAIVIGIDVTGVPPEVVDQLVASAQARAKLYATQNPISADLLVTGVEAGAQAFAAMASGAQTAREAIANFFQSMAAQAAYAIAKLLIVKTLIAAFGGKTTAVGNFLATTFGAAKGAVFPSPGVIAYEQGGVPGRAEREVKKYGTVVHEGLPERRAAVQAFAQGAIPRNQVVRSPQLAPLALFGEAGPEAIMPLDEREGVRGLSPGGTVSLPLARDARGRLSVDLGSVFSALLAQAKDVQAVPFALGGVPALSRALRTEVEPFALGGVPALSRALRTEVEPFALGGVPDLSRALRTHVEPFALGGDFSSSVPLTSAPRAPTASRRVERSTRVEVRPNITINVASLEGQTAAAVILRERETIAVALAQEISRSPLLKAHIRGDRT